MKTVSLQKNVTHTKTPTGVWKRLAKAYLEKKMNDQTFAATVVALQVCFVFCSLAIVILLMMKTNTVGSSFLPANLL